MQFADDLSRKEALLDPVHSTIKCHWKITIIVIWRNCANSQKAGMAKDHVRIKIEHNKLEITNDGVLALHAREHLANSKLVLESGVSVFKRLRLEPSTAKVYGAPFSKICKLRRGVISAALSSLVFVSEQRLEITGAYSVDCFQKSLPLLFPPTRRFFKGPQSTTPFFTPFTKGVSKRKRSLWNC